MSLGQAGIDRAAVNGVLSIGFAFSCFKTFSVVKNGGETGACNNTFDPQAVRKKKGRPLTEQEGGPRRFSLFYAKPTTPMPVLEVLIFRIYAIRAEKRKTHYFAYLWSRRPYRSIWYCGSCPLPEKLRFLNSAHRQKIEFRFRNLSLSSSDCRDEVGARLLPPRAARNTTTIRHTSVLPFYILLPYPCQWPRLPSLGPLRFRSCK